MAASISKERASAGLSLPTIGALLGHSEPATAARYAHLAQDPVKQAADQVSGLIDMAMNSQGQKKVVKLRQD